MNKLLIISGPTASGKTALAIKIAKLIPSELISADSRQIYISLDIGVGKDHPTTTPIHCIDIIYPNQIYSVAQFQKLALEKIADIQSRGKLPIIVGCTAFYIKSLLKNNYQTFSVKPNYFLRFFLDRFSLKLLQITLRLLDYSTFRLLNNSDVHNPRRLIRKIEIKLSNKSFPLGGKCPEGTKGFDTLHISLTAPNKFLFDRVDTRVDDRLKLGHLDELKTLLKKYSWNDPGLKVSAYQSFKNHFTKNESIADAVSRWKFAEHHDVVHHKRAFSTIKDAHFLDISQPNYPKNAIDLIKKWYNK